MQEVLYRRYCVGGTVQEVLYRRYCAGGTVQEVLYRRYCTYVYIATDWYWLADCGRCSGTVHCEERRRDREETDVNLCTTGRTFNGVWTVQLSRDIQAICTIFLQPLGKWKNWSSTFGLSLSEANFWFDVRHVYVLSWQTQIVHRRGNFNCVLRGRVMGYEEVS